MTEEPGKPEDLEVARLQRRLVDFAAARNWQRYHTPKNLVAALSGFGALFAAIPFLIFYGLAFEFALKQAHNAAALGTVTLAAGVFFLHGGAALGFRQMFGMIAATVGLALIAYAGEKWWDKDGGFVLSLAATAAALFVPARWARTTRVATAHR